MIRPGASEPVVLVPDRRLGYEHVKGLPVVDYVASVDLGGPDTYTAQHGGYESMLQHHLELPVTRSSGTASPPR